VIEMHQAVACSRRRARVSLVGYKSQRGGKGTGFPRPVPIRHRQSFAYRTIVRPLTKKRIWLAITLGRSSLTHPWILPQVHEEQVHSIRYSVGDNRCSQVPPAR